MPPVRLGIIGLGLMGHGHAATLLAGKVPQCVLAAVCDTNAAQLQKFPQVQSFASVEALCASGTVDAVLIATPHYAHTTAGITALAAGLHVLVEKPISVHCADARRLIAAHRNPRQVFAAMFNQRTDPYYQTIRRLVTGGELGPVRRVNWTITDWFRPDAYYASSAWRATWAGEGGGVLLNQSPHNLDLLQWIFGMPQRVTGFCGFGRYHPIEVEDDVTAYLEYGDGAHATFITSTGEAPGTNRLEIAAENGRLTYENDRLVWLRTARPNSIHNRTTTEFFTAPPREEVVIPVQGHGGQHLEILQNFIGAIVEGTPLIAPAAEGLRSVELANAILLSAWTKATVELPLDAAIYERLLLARSGIR